MSTTTGPLIDAAIGPKPERKPPRRAWRQKKTAWSPTLSPRQGLLMSLPFISLALVFVVYPFVRLARIAFGDPNGFGNFGDFFKSDANVKALWTTFLIAGIVTAVSIIAGALVAWSLKTTRSRWMRLLLLSAVLVPFWMGSVIKLYAWTVMLQSYGVINRFLMWTGIIDDPLGLLYNQFAVVVGMTYQMLPYSVLPLVVAFSTIELDLVRAAESLGATRLQAIRSVVVPLAIPGVLATVTIVYVISIGFFLTPVVLGGFTAPFSASLISQNIFDFFDLAGAAVTSVMLLIGALGIVYSGYKIVGKDRLRKALG